MPARTRQQVSGAALLAGATVDRVVRERTESMSPRALIGAGILAAGVMALAHLAGADLRGSLAGAHPSLFTRLLGPRDASA